MTNSAATPKVTFVPLPAGVGDRSREAVARELVRDLLAVTPGVLRAAPARRRGRHGVRLVIAA